MQQSVYPKPFRVPWFQDKPHGRDEIDWREPLTQGLYGAWLLGEGPPRNLVDRALDPQASAIRCNFFHGAYSGAARPGPAAEFHGGWASRWSTSNEGIDLSVPDASKIERTESLSIVSHLTPNVTRSGADTPYVIIANNEDGGNLAGWRYFLNWINVDSKTYQHFGLTNNFGGGNYLLCRDLTDIANTRQVLGVTYDGSSAVSGVQFYLSGAIDSPSTVTDALSASCVPATPNPAIGRRTSGGSASQVFKGDISMVFLWRGRKLTMPEMVEVDVNPQMMFLVPSYRRFFLPLATAAAPDTSLMGAISV